jgi:hypothetical protein
MPVFPDPGIDVVIGRKQRWVETIPVEYLVEILFPALIGGFKRWPETHDIDDVQFVGNSK